MYLYPYPEKPSSISSTGIRGAVGYGNVMMLKLGSSLGRDRSRRAPWWNDLATDSALIIYFRLLNPIYIKHTPFDS